MTEKPTCPDCPHGDNRPVDRRGLCSLCYRRALQDGTIQRVKIDNRPIEDRFWESVNKNGPVSEYCPELGPCWLWTDRVFPNGYGLISIKNKDYRAHRIAWVLATGDEPGEWDALHNCHTRLCVNAWNGHLYLGDNNDNIRDMVEAGRNFVPPAAVGEDSSFAKLTEIEVLAIRRLSAEEGVPNYILGRMFNVTGANIGMIIKRRTWKHI